MSTKKRGLGRGLDALLAGSAPVARNKDSGEAAAIDKSRAPDAELREVPVDLLQPGKYQPRTDFAQEPLQELADSIRVQGVVQPIVVRPLDGGRYEIIAGERRWRAAQLAGLHEIPAVVRRVPDSAAIAMALIENIQRENLNPLEEANALNRLIEEFGMTHQQAAEAVGRSRAAVSNLLRLMDLEPPVKVLVEKRQLEMGHARALLALKGAQQFQAAREVADKGLSVRETEKLVRRLLERDTQPAPAAKTVDPDIRRFQEELSEKLGARVEIQHAATGKGKLVIQYNSLDELDGILGHIR
ncbi:MAG TPA: ParB/RepB/Spo0J family partition protein [Gammaproteobacteria bacterium]|nr:ParB/RepB/Spo0J family partition protein [Gammaproteobacteria bacterium]